MTHLYTLLVGGTVVAGGGEPDTTAIAWADDTVLAIGSDEAVRAVSRGDSHLVELRGAFVVPLAAGGEAGGGPDPAWPAEARLEVGGRADLAVLDGDPRLPAPVEPGEPPVSGATARRPPGVLAVVRGGRLVSGELPGGHWQDHVEPHEHGPGAGHREGDPS